MPNFRVVKNQNNGADDDPDKKIVRHRLGKFVRIAVAVAILIAVVVIVRMNYQNAVYTGYDILSKSVRQDSDSAQYIAYNGHILKYSQDGAEAFNGTSDAIWNVTYEMQKPQVATCGDYVAMGDSQGTRILVISSADDQNTIETKLPVMNFCVSKQGVVAAVLDDSGSSWIKLYDKTGTELASVKCSMADSGYPIDISLSDSGILLAVSYMRVDDGKLISSVAFYNFGDVGANESDHYMSGYDYEDTVIPRVKFLNNSTAFALGDNKFIIYSGDQKPEKKFEYDFDTQINGVYYGDDRIGLVRRNGDGDSGYRIDIYNLSGEIVLSQKFDLDYTDIELTENRLMIYNDSRCLIYNMHGKVKFDGAFDDSTLLCAPTSDPLKFVLVNREITQLIKLK